ncbi:MAG: hypothetical protein WCO84_08455 [bacterium]
MAKKIVNKSQNNREKPKSKAEKVSKRRTNGSKRMAIELLDRPVKLNAVYRTFYGFSICFLPIFCFMGLSRRNAIFAELVMTFSVFTWLIHKTSQPGLCQVLSRITEMNKVSVGFQGK